MDEETETSPHPAPAPVPPSRQSLALSYYARIAAAEGRRLQRSMTRANFNAFLKTMAWVAPLTILIWVYAEREGTATQPDVEIHVGVEQMPNRVLTVLYPPDKGFVLELSGPRTRIEHVNDMINRNFTIKPILAEDTPTPFSTQVPVTSLIGNITEFKNEGISVIRCVPEYMTVSVDTLVQKELPVRLGAGATNIVQATFNPPTIKVSGASEAMKKLPMVDGQPAVIVDVANLPSAHTPGQHADQTVALVPVDGVSFSNDNVLATFNVEEQDVELPVPGSEISVQLLNPGDFGDRYKITYDGILGGTVKLTGPSEGIDAVKKGKLIGVLDLTDAKAGADQNKDVRIVLLDSLTLPDGVHVSPDTNLTIKYTITPR
jgi:hypothetical protein